MFQKMAKITFRTQSGDVEVEANDGETILDAANRSGVDIFSTCAGACICGSCHVVVSPKFAQKAGEESAEELDLLDVLPDRQDGSRLACQVIVSDDLDGAIITVL
jgi:2Fe-2S ferredoxin